MRNILKLSSILQILFIIFVSTTSLEAETLFESFGVGLPAINVSDTPEGETTYSLSLQIISINDCLDSTTFFNIRYDFIYSNYYSFINFAPGNGNSTNTTKPSFDCCCSFFNSFHNVTYPF